MVKRLPDYGLIVTSFLLIFYNLILPANAGRLGNGKTFFEHPPLLLEASTTYHEVWVGAAKYYFTISLPENAGEPLKQIVFQQKPSAEMLEFYPDQTVAFVGIRNERGEVLNIQKSQWNSENNSITVIFDPPISPGLTITVGLKPVRNPAIGGTYLFGVTAFPNGAIPAPMYLGVGRLQFYQNYR